MSQVDLLSRRIAPADGEATVRTYFCTFYKSKLLGIEAEGLLSVTNKRVIFHALSESHSGSSVIQSEVAVQDVSGVSSYKGTAFSIGHFLSALVVSWPLAALAPAIMTAIGAATTVNRLESGDWGRIAKPTGALVVGWLIALAALGGSFAVARTRIWRTVLAAVAASTFAALGGATMLSSFGSSLFSSRDLDIGGGFLVLVAAAVGVYALICAFWYSRRPMFTLAIHSKGGSSTPITVSGGTGIGLLTVGAERALRAEPGDEAEEMLKELGAMVLDVQMLGDYGMRKWNPHPRIRGGEESPL